MDLILKMLEELATPPAIAGAYFAAKLGVAEYLG